MRPRQHSGQRDASIRYHGLRTNDEPVSCLIANGCWLDVFSFSLHARDIQACALITNVKSSYLSVYQKPVNHRQGRKWWISHLTLPYLTLPCLAYQAYGCNDQSYYIVCTFEISQGRNGPGPSSSA